MNTLLLSIALLAPAHPDTDWITLHLEGTRALEHGELSRAETALQRSFAMQPACSATAWQLACVKARVKDADAAFDWLSKSLNLGEPEVALLQWDPDLESLRTDSRFESLLQQVRQRELEYEAVPRKDSVAESSIADWLPLWLGAEDFAPERGRLLLRDDRTGEPLRVLAWSADRPFHATISPDDRWLAVANYGTGSRNHKIRLFDARTGDDVIALEGLAKHARVYFSYDSSQMVVSDMQGKRVDLWQVGEWTRTLVGEVPPGFDLYDVSGDGTSIQIEQPALEAITRAHPLRNELWVARTDGQLVCIDASTGRSLRVWKHDNASLTALAIHPQGELIATYDEAGVLRLVSAASGRLVAEHSGSAPKLAKWDAPKLAFSPDGSALLLQLPRIHARVYDADDLKVRWEHPYTSRSRTWSDRCAWSPDGRLLALVTDECEVALFDAENGDESIPRISTDARIEPISFQPKSGSLWVGTDASKVQVFDHRTGEAIRSIDHSRLDPFGFEFGSITFRADGAVAVTASSGYGIVAAWDTKSFTRLWKYDFGGGNPACLLNQFGQDGALIYVWGQGDGTSLILDAASGKTVLSPSNRNAHELIPLAGEAVFGAQGWYQLAVLDIKEGQSRWQRHEVTGGGWILRSPSGHFDASGQALDRCTIVTDEAQASYEALASVLLDPKRVRAAAAGVPLRRVMMPKLPELSWSVPQPREFTLAPREAAPDLTLVASSPEGVRGFEVRVDGVSNTFAGKPRSKTERELVLDIERPTSSQEIDYRIRPIGMNGVLGRAIHLRVRAVD